MRVSMHVSLMDSRQERKKMTIDILFFIQKKCLSSDKDNRLECWRQFRLPIYRHSAIIFPCCRAILHVSPLKIRNWDPTQMVRSAHVTSCTVHLTSTIASTGHAS